MVAADSDSDRGLIAAFQRAVAARAAAAAATGGAFRFRERAAHCPAARRRALSRPQRHAAREPEQDQLRGLPQYPVPWRAGAMAWAGAVRSTVFPPWLCLRPARQ